MEKTDLKKSDKVFLALITVFSVVMPLVLIPFHEQWRDEAQAWLLVRDCNFIELLKMLKYEGHPLLWYLILMPFAKMGLPFSFINYISWFFASCGIVLFIFKAPFGKAVKAITAISPVFVYWLPVVARSYSLVPLMLFVMAYIYHERKEKAVIYGVFIALLVNLHILMAGICGALLLNELIDIIIDAVKKNKVSKQRYIGFACGFIGCLVMVIQMWGCMEQNGVVKVEIGQISYLAKAYQNSIIFQMHMFGFWKMEFYLFMMLMFLLFLAIMFIMLLKYRRQLIMLVCGVGFDLFVTLLLFVPNGQKAQLIYIMLLFIAWTLRTDTDDGLKKIQTDKKDIRYSTAFALMISIMLAVNIANCWKSVIIYDIGNKFSSGKAAAEYLDANSDECSVVIPIDDMLGASASAHTKKVRFWNMYNNEYCDYAILNMQRAYAMYDFEQYINKTEKDENGEEHYTNSVKEYMQECVSKNFAKGTKVALLVCRIYYPRFDMEFEPVFVSEECSYYSFSEGYKIYILTA